VPAARARRLCLSCCFATKNYGRALAGRAFNIGGGPANAISLLDLLDRIEALHGRRPQVAYDGWRTGDQRYYVSDTRAFEQATGWRQKMPAREGIARLYEWITAHRKPMAVPQEPAVAGAH
jgi:CDP-paratose 2-epimerase